MKWCVCKTYGKDHKIVPVEFDPTDSSVICGTVISHKDFDAKEEAEKWIQSAVQFGHYDFYTIEELYELNNQKDERIKELELFIKNLSDLGKAFLNKLPKVGRPSTEAHEL